MRSVWVWMWPRTSATSDELDADPRRSTWAPPRIAVSGVRSSWEASAMNRRIA